MYDYGGVPVVYFCVVVGGCGADSVLASLFLSQMLAASLAPVEFRG